MFTGLIQEVGKVLAITQGQSSARVKIICSKLLSELKIGDSVSVNGACLTVTDLAENTFSVDVMVKTLELTSTGFLEIGSKVNLELATRTIDRLGGHIVQGHVDGLAVVKSLSVDDKWTRMDLQIPIHLMKYVVPQGSICIEGVSLTVGEIRDQENEISVWLIPETLANTNLSIKNSGDLLNIEVDVLAKYVERLMSKKAGLNESN